MSVMQWKQSICGFVINLQWFVLLVCLNPAPIDLSHRFQLLLSACTCKNQNFHVYKEYSNFCQVHFLKGLAI